MGKSYKNLFICLTPLHFYFSYSIAEMLYLEDKSNSLIVVKGAYQFNGKPNKDYLCVKYIQNKTFAQKLFCKCCYDYLWNFTVYNKFLNSDIQKLFVFNLNDPVTKNAINAASKGTEVIYTEEGLGSWTHEWNGNQMPRRINTALIGEPKMFNRLHTRFNGTVVRLIYKNVFNRDSSIEFSKIMSDEAMPSDAQFLYLGVCEGELIETKEELSMLRRVINELPVNEKLYIKKHPRDSSPKYAELLKEFNNVKLISSNLNEVPVECLIWLSNIKCVISIISSASFYLPKFKQDIKSIFLFKLQSLPELGLTNEFRLKETDYAKFEELIKDSGNIFCPISENEITELLLL